MRKRLVTVRLLVKREGSSWPARRARQCPCGTLAMWSIGILTERNVLGLPWVANPDITSCNSGMVPASGNHLLGQLSFLRLVLVLQNGQYQPIKIEGKPKNSRAKQI